MGVFYNFYDHSALCRPRSLLGQTLLVGGRLYPKFFLSFYSKFSEERWEIEKSHLLKLRDITELLNYSLANKLICSRGRT